MTHRACVLVALCCSVVVSPALAQQSLPVGQPGQGRVADGEAAEFTFAAASAGVLTVAVHGEGDLAIDVIDEDGQTLPEGSTDRDMFGSLGTEYLSVILGQGGAYRVRVRLLGGEPGFQIAGAWTTFPALERPVDPDGRPSRATALEVGREREDSLDSAQGDSQDWFVFKPAEGGVLTVAIRPIESELDLVLELYIDDFDESAERSDQDLQDNPGNEAATISVKAGQAVHVKVTGFSSAIEGRYRLSSSLLP